MYSASSFAEVRPRCIRACEPCRRKRERCSGDIPCVLCVRRGIVASCQLTPSRSVSQRLSFDAIPGPANPAKRQKNNSSARSSSDEFVFVPKTSRFLPCHVSAEANVHIGDSSTLGMLHFVHDVVLHISRNGEFTLDPTNDFMLEVETSSSDSLQYARMEDVTRYETSFTLAQFYFDFTRGIFDLFPEEDILESLRSSYQERKNQTKSIVNNTMLLLVLAIGAQERQEDTDNILGEVLFQKAYNDLSLNLLCQPTLATVQILLLTTLYLLIACRRNSAFVHLGTAVRSAHTIGLQTTLTHATTFPEILKAHQDARMKAWKCLRVLELSSCAALGRPLATTEENGEKLLEEPINSIEGDTNQSESSDHLINLASIKLCFIAEKILKTVYQERKLSLRFAHSMSQCLRDWSKSLPNVFINTDDQNDIYQSHIEIAELPHQLCRNHMTAAYYWTIILLTRPFLMNDVAVKVGLYEGDLHEKVKGMSGSSSSMFIDACIDSAFRCLDATIILVKQMPLGKKLFLVVNTTLVSALVLGLATFGDYDKALPLDAGLEKAENFLRHMASHDPQAAQYLDYVQRVRTAAQNHCKRRAAAEMKKRSAHVAELFGTVSRREHSESVNRFERANRVSSNLSILSQDVAAEAHPMIDHDESSVQPLLSEYGKTVHPNLDFIYSFADERTEDGQSSLPVSVSTPLLPADIGDFNDFENIFLSESTPTLVS